MSKPRRRKPRQRPQPPLPQLGHYVLSFQAPDGSMQDPPIPLDQRLTDAELHELVDGVHAKLKARQSKEATIRLAKTGEPDSSPLDVPKFLNHSTVCRGPAADTGPSLQGDNSSGTPPSDSREATPRVEAKLTGVEPKDILVALSAHTGESMSPEEADRVLAANGIPPAQVRADARQPPSPLPNTPQRAPAIPSPDSDDGWGDAAGAIIYRSLCLSTGAFLVGGFLILGGWAALKVLPWLELVLSGQSG
jgi:hypothetical protein